jgi:hypothetical protein
MEPSEIEAAGDVFTITVGLANDEYDGGLPDPDKVVGLRPEDLPELEELWPAAKLSTRVGEVGKGASGPGVTLVIEMVERVINDGGSFISWGTLLWHTIRYLKRRRPDRSINLDDPRTIAAVGAARALGLQARIAKAYFKDCLPLTGGGPQVGTDLRDVWQAVFVTDDGWVLAIFMSPSGLVLGQVTVPSEFNGKILRSPEEIRDLFARENTPTAEDPSHL